VADERAEAIAKWQTIKQEMPEYAAQADAELGKLGAVSAPMASPQPGPYADSYHQPPANERPDANVQLTEKPSLLGEIGSGFVDMAKIYGRGIKALGEEAWREASHPIDTFKARNSPETAAKKRQVLRGFDDSMTFGFGGAAYDLARRKLFGETSEQQEAQAAADEESFPGLRTGGSLIGMLTPGGTSGAGRAGVAAANRVIRGTGKLASTGKGMLAAAVTVPGVAGAQATARGENPLPAVEQALTDPFTYVAAGIPLAMAMRMSGRVRDPRKPTGRILQTVAENRGEVRMFGDEPVTGGVYETPALQTLPEGREGVNRAAADAGRTFTRINRRMVRRARRAYSQQLREIARDNPGPVDITPVTEELRGLIRHQSNGEIANPEVAAAVADVERLITQPAEPGPELFGPSGERLQTGRPAEAAATLQDLRQAREVVADRAQFGEPVTKDNAPYRVIHRALGQASKRIDPRLAVIDEAFSTIMSRLERANDIVYGKDTPDVADRAAAERTAAATFGRLGDSSQAGTLRADQLDELARISPSYERLTRHVRAKKAQEELRYDNEGATQGNFEETAARSSRTLPVVGKPLEWLGYTPRDQRIMEMRIGLPMAERVTPAAVGGLIGGSLQAGRKKARVQRKGN
jgi:hypothetical protein